MGFNGVVLKAFASPCLFPWACHARLFYFSKLQGVSLWYSCSDSLDSFLDKALISQRCPILKGLFFTARKLWLALLFRKTCRCLFFGFFVEPWDYPSSAQQYFVCNFWCIFSKPLIPNEPLLVGFWFLRNPEVWWWFPFFPENCFLESRREAWRCTTLF